MKTAYIISRNITFKMNKGKSLLSLMLTLLLALSAGAQVSGYLFSRSIETYTPITGGTLPVLIGNEGVAPNPGNFVNTGTTGIPLGFTFMFNSVNYTTCALTSNGAISFGGPPIAPSNQRAISSTESYHGCISILSSILQGQPHATLGEIRYETLGSPGSRVFIIQWSNTRRYYSGQPTSERFEMQIQLYETSNIIKLVYGNFSTAQESVGYHGHEVGLRGNSNTDFKNVRVTGMGNWSNPAQGTSNTDQCAYSDFFPATKPVSGQTYTFTPPPPCVAPTTQPTNLSFSTNTNTSISGSFTAAVPAPTKYMIVRSNSAIAPTPVSGNFYSNSSTALGAGTYVVQNSASGFFTDSNLVGGTTYYYHIFSYNDGCTGSPIYATGVPLTGSFYTLCNAATGLTAETITATTSVINWTENQNVVVEYGPPGFTPGAGTVPGVGGTIASLNATKPYTLTGLQSSTPYQIYIRAICPLGGISPNSSPTSFTTLCIPVASYPHTQIFPVTQYPPICWTEGLNGNLITGPATVGNDASAWKRAIFLNNFVTAESYGAGIQLRGRVNDWLLSSYYSIGPAMQLRFNVGMVFGESYAPPTRAWDPGDYVELVCSTNMTNWTVLKTYNSENTPLYTGQTDFINLAAFAGQTIRFAFRLVRSNPNTNIYTEFFIDNFTLEAAPASAPSCASGMSPANLATDVLRNGSLSWLAATGEPLSYDVYFGTETSPPFFANAQQLSISVPSSLENTVYYWKVVPKNFTGSASDCPVMSFTTGSNYQYCTQPLSGNSFGIVRVQLKTLTNNTASSGGYTYYNSVNVPDLYQMETNDISTTFTSHSGTLYGGIWIDYNNNGQFEMSEGVTFANPAPGTPFVTQITIPLNTPTGLKRMRVRGGSQQPYTSACGATTGGTGETEDYLINILPMPTDLPDNYNLQAPANASVIRSQQTVEVYGHVSEAGLTDTTSGQAPGIQAWVGISPVNQNTHPETWTTWIPATFHGENANSDVYKATIGSGLSLGTYYYAMRYRLNGGAYVYGGFPNNPWDGADSNSGVLTVTPYLPGCASPIAPANGATNMPDLTTLEWAAPTSGATVISYQIYAGPEEGALSYIGSSNTTSYVLPVAAGSTIYWMVVPVSADGSAMGCADTYSFSTATNQFAPYCGVSYSTVYPITLVQYAGINNSSSGVINGSPYHENFISIAGNVVRGQPYQLIIESNTNGQFNVNYIVCIDLNQDGILDPWEEGILMAPTSAANGKISRMITIPTYATPGPTRMRIKAGRTQDLDNLCTHSLGGQIEDYTINIICAEPNYYADADNDGFGDPNASVPSIDSSCVIPAGYVTNQSDCNDADNNIYPGAVEIFGNIIDDNCNGIIDNDAADCTFTTTWNGTSWIPFVPVANQAAIIDGPYNSAGDLSACTLTINSGDVTINSGDVLYISGAVNVNAGSLTFENNAHLLQDTATTTNVNTGNITFKRNASMRRLDYVFWGSPVAGQNLKAFSPETLHLPTSRFYTLNEPTNSFASVDPLTTQFEDAKGYMIRAPNTFPANGSIAVFQGTFHGVPNNGSYSVPISHSLTPVTSSGYNLIGNPYPSPVDATAFLTANPGTLYFWTHGDQNPDSNNYATFNLSGTSPANGPMKPNGHIQAGQGFLLHTAVVPDGSMAHFTNAMRSNDVDGQFYRSSEQKDRFWLNLSNASTPSINQALIGYFENATEDFDPSYDGLLNFGGSSISSKIGSEHYIIQARSLPFNNTDEVPLTFIAATEGTFTISIESPEGLFATQDIYLKDAATGIVHDLNAAAYSFASTAGIFADRFSIVYQNTTLGIDPVAGTEGIVVFKKDNKLTVDAGSLTLDSVSIFDLRGRLLARKTDIGLHTTTIFELMPQEQVLLVQVWADGKTITRKVVY